MRTGAEESEARVVMLHKQGGLFRIIVQNLHEKISDRSGTRGTGILTPRQRRQGVPVRRRPATTIARQEPTVWPGSPETRQARS